jgi:tetratricopeptide (TPR) repeat protein
MKREKRRTEYTQAQARADRESYPNSDARFEAYFAAAKAYASVGETEAAQRAINDALTGRDIDGLDIDKASAFAWLSVQIGHSKEFQNEVRKSDNENFRRFALREVAEALARNGKVDEALEAVRDNHESSRIYDLEAVTRVLDKGALTEQMRSSLHSIVETSLSKDEIEISNKVVLRANAAQVLFRLDKKDEAEQLIRDAVKIARDIAKEKWKPRSYAYSDIVDALLEFEKFDDAMIAYREITAQPIQMIAASKIVLKLIETGRTQEALSVASKVNAASLDYSNNVFAAIAIKTARDGNIEEALAIIGNIADTGGQNKIASADSAKEDALIGIAKAMAKKRRYRSVLELIDQYPVLKDQLTIYSAVLREYAKERNPKLATLLEVKENGEAIFPWLQ